MKNYSSIFLYLFLIALANGVFAGRRDSLKTDTIKTIQNDFVFSFTNNILTNPALTGFSKGITLQLKSDFDNPLFIQNGLYNPQQYYALTDIAFGKKKNNAVGLYFIEAKFGTFETKSYGFSFARNFDLHFSKSTSFYHKLRIGISFDNNIVNLNYNKTTWGDQINPRYGFLYATQEKILNSSSNYSSLNLSGWYNNPILYFGLTSKNIIIEDKTALLSNLKAQMEYVISCGGNIKLDKYFTLHPSIFMNIINEYKGNFNSYEPAILCTFKGNYLFGISYKDLNKITIHAGAMLFKRLTISAACGFSTNSDFNEFGEPAYIGGNIKIYFGKI